MIQVEFDMSDVLQAASFERDTNSYSIEFQSSKAPGFVLERRGHWAVASVVSDSLSRKISQGSMLSAINGQKVIVSGFDSVLSKLSIWKVSLSKLIGMEWHISFTGLPYIIQTYDYCQAPLHLTFWLSPQKMGWLSMMVTDNRKGWKSSKIVSWGE
jgi:hypothetical protein